MNIEEKTDALLKECGYPPSSELLGMQFRFVGVVDTGDLLPPSPTILKSHITGVNGYYDDEERLTSIEFSIAALRFNVFHVHQLQLKTHENDTFDWAILYRTNWSNGPNDYDLEVCLGELDFL